MFPMLTSGGMSDFRLIFGLINENHCAVCYFNFTYLQKCHGTSNSNAKEPKLDAGKTRRSFVTRGMSPLREAGLSAIVLHNAMMEITVRLGAGSGAITVRLGDNGGSSQKRMQDR